MMPSPGEAGRDRAVGAAYDRVWGSFLSAKSTADGRHDTPAWRSHPGHYAACVIRVMAPALQPDLGLLQHQLGTIPGVRVHPDHFLHIMLQELGFVVEHPLRSNEITSSRLEEFAQAAIEPITATAPFALALGWANSFQDAVFLELDHIETVTRLHERLFDLATVRSSSEFAFLPHCTLAHYDGSARPREAAAVLQPWRTAMFGGVPVPEIEIVTLDPAQAYPTFESYAVIPLGG